MRRATAPQTLRAFAAKFPAVWQRYQGLCEACDRSGPLDARTRELIKVGIEAARKRHGGLVAHIHRARQAGASDAAVYQAILLAAPLIGLPEVLDAFLVAKRALR